MSQSILDKSFKVQISNTMFILLLICDKKALPVDFFITSITIIQCCLIAVILGKKFVLGQ